MNDQEQAIRLQAIYQAAYDAEAKAQREARYRIVTSSSITCHFPHCGCDNEQNCGQ